MRFAVLEDMPDTIDPVLAALKTDFQTYRIEGFAHQGNTPVACPLVTQVDGDLWQGGCVSGVSLRGYFKHIISLYPWERYDPGGPVDSFLEVRLYDGAEIPDADQLYALARYINFCKRHGRTLVHCQAGLNRSGLLTGLSLVLDGVKADTAITLMRTQRSPAVLCNKQFENWLRAESPVATV